jgi:hypothetical protein
MFAFFLHSTAVQDINIVGRFMKSEDCKQQMKTILYQLDKYAKDKKAKTYTSVYTQTDIPYKMNIPLEKTFTVVGMQTDFPSSDDDYIDIENY